MLGGTAAITLRLAILLAAPLGESNLTLQALLEGSGSGMILGALAGLLLCLSCCPLARSLRQGLVASLMGFLVAGTLGTAGALSLLLSFEGLSAGWPGPACLIGGATALVGALTGPPPADLVGLATSEMV